MTKRNKIFYNSKQRAVDSYIDEDACCQGNVNVQAIIETIFDNFTDELEIILNDIKYTKDIDIAKLKIISLKTKIQ